MRVLVACEYSGRVRDAFTARGHFAMSCDLLPSDTPGPHYQGDLLNLIRPYGPQRVKAMKWDLLIAFPPCTDLSSVGARYWPQKQADGRQGRALAFVQLLMDAPIDRIAIENPAGRINTAIRKPDQIIQPWMFGDPWTKRTCLWLKNLPPLKSTDQVAPQGFWVGGGSKADGHSVSSEGARQHRTGKDKWKELAHDRNKTFAGIAAAMADQWGV